MLTNVRVLTAVFFCAAWFLLVLLLANTATGDRSDHTAAHQFANEGDDETVVALDRIYAFESIVRLNEVNKTNSEGDLAYQTSGNVRLSVLWQNPEDRAEKLLQFRVSIVQHLPTYLATYGCTRHWLLATGHWPLATGQPQLDSANT